MIDFGRLIGFEWDSGNGRKSADKHGVEQREAEQIFNDPRMLVLRDDGHSDREERFQAYGATQEGRLLQVSFTLRQNATMIRVISARNMSRRERKRYEEEEA